MKFKNLVEAAKAVEVCMGVIEALEARVAELESRPTSARNYGPKSETPMTEELAWRIRYGDLTTHAVKDIADEHGLSRGQVYSVRGNYTFTKITADSFRFEESDDEVKIVANS